jgi:hypothetical protein
MDTTIDHPIFVRNRRLPEPWREHFPKSADEAAAWTPAVHHVALSARVLAVYRTRIEGAWAAYVDAVPGQDHRKEREAVLETGAKLAEPIARLLFPHFNHVPYAE